MKVSVTQKHIDKGIDYDCLRCPIALALLDLGLQCKVYEARVEVLTGGSGSYSLPRSAQEFIDAFDRDLPVAPFAFSMRRIRDANS